MGVPLCLLSLKPVGHTSTLVVGISPPPKHKNVIRTGNPEGDCCAVNMDTAGSDANLDLGKPSSPMTPRSKAYAEARILVADLYAVKNDKGYPRFSGSVNDVINQEIKIAHFLLGDEY